MGHLMQSVSEQSQILGSWLCQQLVLVCGSILGDDSLYCSATRPALDVYKTRVLPVLTSVESIMGVFLGEHGAIVVKLFHEFTSSTWQTIILLCITLLCVFVGSHRILRWPIFLMIISMMALDIVLYTVVRFLIKFVEFTYRSTRRGAQVPTLLSRVQLCLHATCLPARAPACPRACRLGGWRADWVAGWLAVQFLAS